MPITLRTMMRKGASRSTAKPACAGKRASGTKRPGGNMPPRRANWQPTARVCMATWHIRIAQVGNTIKIEKTSFKGWQKQYGRSIGLRAPGMFVAHLTRIVAKTGGTLVRNLSLQNQTESVLPSLRAVCQESRGHSAGMLAPADWDQCNAISTRLSRLSYLEPGQTQPSITQHVWEGAGLAGSRLRAVMEGLQQRGA